MDAMPRFKLKDENGEPLDSRFLEGMTYVLCFVPDLGEDSCRLLSDADSIYPKLMIRNTPVLAAVPSPVPSIGETRDRLGLKIKVLSDEDGTLAGQCGIEGIGALVVGRDGNIASRHTGEGVMGAVYASVKSLLK